MRGLALAVLCLLFFPGAAALAWETETLEENGPSANRVDLVILGDGYTASEQDAFRDDALGLMGYFFSSTPFAEYRVQYNVHIVYVISPESGADHPSRGIYRDTALNATYEFADLDRFLVVDEEKALIAALDAAALDYVFVLVNDAEYGGSGGTLAVTSVHEQAPEILAHEVGHMFGELADEYEDPFPGHPPDDWEANVTFETRRERIKWNVWIDAATPLPTPPVPEWAEAVGLFEGARYLSEGIYRPRLDCRMRTLGVDFCEICAEHLIRSIYATVSPSDAEGGGVRIAANGRTTLDARLLQTDPPAVRADWTIDGAPVAADALAGRLLLNAGGLGQGFHEVAAFVRDESEWLRLPEALDEASAEVRWTVEVTDEIEDGDEAIDGDGDEPSEDGDAADGDETPDGDEMPEDGDAADGDEPSEDGDAAHDDEAGGSGGGLCRGVGAAAPYWLVLAVGGLIRRFRRR
ncbi:MAG: hypothetical protein C4523_12195 [Myxococcales bacterium]|nr:MAG: hypothetical protein C4523_12195 [Myxococcales bacterium]